MLNLIEYSRLYLTYISLHFFHLVIDVITADSLL